MQRLFFVHVLTYESDALTCAEIGDRKKGRLHCWNPPHSSGGQDENMSVRGDTVGVRGGDDYVWGC